MRAVAALLLLLCAACGGDEGPEGPPYVAQEVWITYNAPEFAKFGTRSGRTRDEAKKHAEELRAKVLGGADVGAIADEESNALGGAALGYSAWISEERGNWAVRGPALAATRVGEVTPLFEWMGGWWFARRVSAAEGRELEKLFDRRQRQRARIAAIWIGHKDIQDQLEEGDVAPQRTKEEARERADEALRRVLGGAGWEDVVRVFSDHVETRERGGLVVVENRDPDTGAVTKTDWLRWKQPFLAREVLHAAFEGEVGKVWPHVVENRLGFWIVKVLERRE